MITNNSFNQKQVNVAVQVLPSSKTKDSYALVDAAIQYIKDSGVNYKVTPFETVMEGTYQRLMEIVEGVQQICYNAGADSLMCYVKIQSHRVKDVTMDDKLAKYE